MKYLEGQGSKTFPMTFKEVERLLGTPLPLHRANESAGHVHAKAWLQAGYETEQVDMEGKKLVFRKIANRPPLAPKGGELSDSARDFVHPECIQESHAASVDRLYERHLHD